MRDTRLRCQHVTVLLTEDVWVSLLSLLHVLVLLLDGLVFVLWVDLAADWTLSEVVAAAAVVVVVVVLLLLLLLLACFL